MSLVPNALEFGMVVQVAPLFGEGVSAEVLVVVGVERTLVEHRAIGEDRSRVRDGCQILFLFHTVIVLKC